MTWYSTPAFRRAARIVVVVGLAGGAYLGAVNEPERILPRAVIAAVLVVAAAAVLVPRAPRDLAPAVLVAATTVLGPQAIVLLLVSLFDLAAQQKVRKATAIAVAAVVAGALGPTSLRIWTPDFTGTAATIALVIVWGSWLGHRQERLAGLTAEVERLRVERELTEDTVRAEERARIAAEMHDVLAHRLSLIALHSGVLEATAQSRPDRVAERVALLREASTRALTDLRSVLGALDHGGDHQPRPTLVGIDELADDARAAGQDVALVVDGENDDVPAAHKLAVQRVVQEGLTNTRKHSIGGTVEIAVSYGAEETVVSVLNTGGEPARTTVPSGYGLVGLRERVAALGGTFEGGPIADDGWRVHARIPREVAS